MYNNSSITPSQNNRDEHLDSKNESLDETFNLDETFDTPLDETFDAPLDETFDVPFDEYFNVTFDKPLNKTFNNTKEEEKEDLITQIKYWKEKYLNTQEQLKQRNALSPRTEIKISSSENLKSQYNENTLKKIFSGNNETLETAISQKQAQKKITQLNNELNQIHKLTSEQEQTIYKQEQEKHELYQKLQNFQEKNLTLIKENTELHHKKANLHDVVAKKNSTIERLNARIKNTLNPNYDREVQNITTPHLNLKSSVNNERDLNGSFMTTVNDLNLEELTLADIEEFNDSNNKHMNLKSLNNSFAIDDNITTQANTPTNDHKPSLDNSFTFSSHSSCLLEEPPKYTYTHQKHTPQAKNQERKYVFSTTASFLFNPSKPSIKYDYTHDQKEKNNTIPLKHTGNSTQTSFLNTILKEEYQYIHEKKAEKDPCATLRKNIKDSVEKMLTTKSIYKKLHVFVHAYDGVEDQEDQKDQDIRALLNKIMNPKVSKTTIEIMHNFRLLMQKANENRSTVFKKSETHSYKILTQLCQQNTFLKNKTPYIHSLPKIKYIEPLPMPKPTFDFLKFTRKSAYETRKKHPIKSPIQNMMTFFKNPFQSTKPDSPL